MNTKPDFWHIWTIPLILAVVSLWGLLSALVGDGLLDFFSWLTLSIPLLVIARFVMKPTAGKKKVIRK
ncbi:hypothetical protein [Spirosoma pollinicola]|uniref:DUF4175 domain-containing protein n=1 Tax=Spirosoma pollinicola TaxID=2057025 RepID=A0A2K8YYV1_9BACT|nr:hypothetical protein [Spirosoma pollinicola]AUD02817.1 hypothetical protein CWM47_13830 [Spirosoma pollinicola]